MNTYATYRMTTNSTKTINERMILRNKCPCFAIFFSFFYYFAFVDIITDIH